MRCDRAREQIGPLLDGELSDAEGRALLAHAEECPACARHRVALQRLRAQLALVRTPAPRALAQRVHTRLEIEAAAPPEGAGASLRQWWASGAARLARSRLLRHAAVLLIACAISAAATLWWVRGNNAHDTLAHDVVAAHIRSLLQDSTVQVAASDSHVVKPWFAGRVEFTPVVKDLAADGFQLVGGRLDYVGGRRVAAMVYSRRLHRINLFVWPSTGGDSTPMLFRINGYNLVSWSRAGMTFWAVSDLNEGELRELPALL